MKIAFCASEAVPFAKTGGLADVCGALPLELEELGFSVVLVLPKYPSVRNSGVLFKSLNEDFDVGVISENARVFCYKNDAFFRQGLYGDRLGDYPDNLKRFSVFCSKTLELFDKLKYEPDVIHCHDWQTALVSVYLKDRRIKNPSRAHRMPRTLLTIHNVAYQGIFPKEQMPQTNLGWEYFSVAGLEFYDNINLLKGGILFSDYVNTVSVTYAHEIQTTDLGSGLQGVLLNKKDRFTGILNGIDYRIWNPQGDKQIFRSYSVQCPQDKLVNKVGLQESCGLVQGEKIPLLGFVGRLVEQKGIELMLRNLPVLCQQGIQSVFLGMGEPKYENALTEMARRFPGFVHYSFKFDDRLAHQIYAGSDMFLMPSRFEPCGLGQLISFKYGTVPVCFKTGGLADTVVDATLEPKKGTGFVFTQYDSEALMKAIQRGILLFHDTKKWAELVKNIMHLNYSWKESARHYGVMYERLRQVEV
jgi:starch synthase